MSEIERTLFYIPGLKVSSDAFNLLRNKGIDFKLEEMSSTTPEFGELPLLMVGNHRWEGSEAIQVYVDNWPVSDLGPPIAYLEPADNGGGSIN